MLYHLSLLVLGPVFVVQGKYVRRVTPELPEPKGQRSGEWVEDGHEPEEKLRLLIAGDSAAAGVGVDQQGHALSGRLTEAVAQTHALDWKLLAQTGDKSEDLLAKLESEPPGQFDVVVISIGVNDVTKLVSVKTWLANLRNIVDVLQNKFGAQRIYFSSIPPMHLFPALPQPLRWWLGTRARQLNHLMRDFAADCDACVFVDTPFELDVEHMAEDGFHPGAPVYKVWGEHVAELIKQDHPKAR